MRRLLAAAPLAALVLLEAHGLPYAWTHDLAPNCRWKAAAWPAVAFVMSQPMQEADRVRKDRCWAAHGSHARGPLPKISLMLTKWPTAAEVAAWSK